MMIKRLFVPSLCALLAFGQAAQAHAADELNVKQLVADTFIRSAVSYASFAPSMKGDAAYVVAATLLDKALVLDPGNAQAWAMRAELALSAAQADEYETALAGYLDTGIDDDQARYNLIRQRLYKNDTLDAQYASLEGLINGEEGRALSGPLRSRLASLAAALAGEMLDETARRRWIVEAARSDPANAEAARAILELVTTLSDDVVRRGTATVNVIRADPLNPLPRLELASMLANHGAYTRAAQQYQVISTRLARQPMPLSAYLSWAHSLAMIGEDDTAAQLISDFEKALNQAPPPQAEDEKPAPAEHVDLPLGMELVLLATLDAKDEQAKAQVVFDRIAARLSKKPEAQDKPENADANEDPEVQLALIAAVFGPDLDQAEQLINADGPLPVAKGWVALRRGDMVKAEQLLRPLEKEQPLAACGLAIALGTDTQGRARLLQSFLNDASASSLAALAAGRALLSMDTAPWPSATGKTLADLMGKYPESFWLVDLERTPWLEVRLKIDPQRITTVQPINAQITLWNTTRQPLAIGQDAPISPKAMILLTGASSGMQLPPLPPIVVDLGRSFTLKAGERMIIDTRLDYHYFGSLRWDNLGAPVIFDARLVVNPTPMPGGNFLPNGIGGIAELRKIFIQTTPATEGDIDPWLKDLAGEDAPKRIQAICRLASLDAEKQPKLVSPALLTRVRPAMIEAWDKRAPIEQAWIIANLINLSNEGTSYPDIINRTADSSSEIVWMMLLSRHARDADSPLLRSAIARQDMPDLSRFAERFRRMLREIEQFNAELEQRNNEQAPTEQQP